MYYYHLLLSNNEVGSSFNYVSSIYKSSLLTTSHPRTRPRLAIVATALASKTKQVHFPFLCEGVVNFLLSATIRGCCLKKRGHYNIIRPLTFFQTRSMDQIVALTTDKLPCPTVSDWIDCAHFRKSLLHTMARRHLPDVNLELLKSSSQVNGRV